MKFTIPRVRLVAALERGDRITPNRSTIPILANVRITADKSGALEIEATDLELLYRARLDGIAVETSGATTIGSHALLGLAKRMTGTDVEISVDGEGRMARIASGRSKYNLPVLPASDFGTFDPPSPEEAATVTIWPEAYLSCVESVAFAANTEETRHYLCGIYMTDEEGGLRTVATDGHRIAFARSAAEHVEISGGFGTIVPTRTATTIADMVRKRDARLVLRFSDSRMSASVEGEGMVEEIVSVVIDGVFPDWRRLRFERRAIAARIDRAAFKGAVECILVIAGDKTKAVRLRVGRAGLEILSWGQASGAGREDVPATRVDDGDGLEGTATNGLYLSSILDAADGAREVEMSFDSDNAPIVFSAVGRDDWGVTLMPIRLDHIVTVEVE